MSTHTRKFVIQPIPAREGDRFCQCCECCDSLLASGNFVVVIQVKYPNHTANLFLGCKIDCPVCGEKNTLLKVFDNEDKVTTEMHSLAEDIRNSNGIIRAPIIPDISEKDLRDIFEN